VNATIFSESFSVNAAIFGERSTKVVIGRASLSLSTCWLSIISINLI